MFTCFSAVALNESKCVPYLSASVMGLTVYESSSYVCFFALEMQQNHLVVLKK